MPPGQVGPRAGFPSLFYYSASVVCWIAAVSSQVCELTEGWTVFNSSYVCGAFNAVLGSEHLFPELK